MTRPSSCLLASAAALLQRVPFLYVVGLYYGHLVHVARTDQVRSGRQERERRDTEMFLEVTSAATSTLDLHQVLFVVVRKIAELSAERLTLVATNEPIT